MPEAGSSLAAELAISDVEHDALVTVLGSFFPRGEWQSGGEVVYRTGDGEIGLTLHYGRDGLRDARRGPGLSDAMLSELKERVALLVGTDETEIWRDVFFNVFPVEGFWRYRDDWQILPAPPQAPRPDVLIADHPFIVEIRLPSYAGQTMLPAMTRERRAWELQLILNLVLRAGVKRFGARYPGHVWAYVSDGIEQITQWVQPGYLIPDWIYLSEEFTPIADIPAVPEVADEEYRSHRGIGVDDRFEIPDVLRRLLDQYHEVASEVRERFLRACYSYERSGAVWSMSVSLSHIATVNAIETLMPAGAVDRCPTCGLNRAPGVSRRFRDFVERYAFTTPDQDRHKIYPLRSAVVHEGHLLDIDVPGPWGALVPREIEQQATYESARATAREAIVNWLLDQ